MNLFNILTFYYKRRAPLHKNTNINAYINGNNYYVQKEKGEKYKKSNPIHDYRAVAEV